MTAPHPAGAEPIDAQAPPPPRLAAEVFGARLATAQRYAAVLAGAGVDRGLIGPREVPRLWDRHLLNCAVVTELLPAGARVVDVGSGAGLPGLALALRRPDLRVDLVEPLLRRTRFLDEVVVDLGLAGSVRVVRGRAEDVRATVGGTEWVVARAVAPLDRLARWCLPLLVPEGQLLALKGQSVGVEIADTAAALRSLGVSVRVTEVGSGRLAEPTRIAVVQRRPVRGSRRTQ